MKTSLSLADLIDFKAGDSQLDLGQGLGGLASVKASVLKSANLRRAVSGALSQALDVDILTLLGPAWQVVDTVHTALKVSRVDSAATALIPLAPHRLKSSHAPTVTLVIAGCPSIDLAFTVEFLLKIDGAELDIAGGEIKGLKSGSLSSQATVKLAGHTLLNQTSPRLDLPGRLHFRPATPADAIAAV